MSHLVLVLNKRLSDATMKWMPTSDYIIAARDKPANKTVSQNCLTGQTDLASQTCFEEVAVKFSSCCLADGLIFGLLLANVLTAFGSSHCSCRLNRFCISAVRCQPLAKGICQRPLTIG